jgi:hypothetical protein
MAEIVERGEVLRLRCPEAEGGAGQFAIVLRPAGRPGFRRLVVSEPEPESERREALVDRVSASAAEPFGGSEPPLGEGIYVLVRHGGETHLVLVIRRYDTEDVPPGTTFRLVFEGSSARAAEALDHEGASLELVA